MLTRFKVASLFSKTLRQFHWHTQLANNFGASSIDEHYQIFMIFADKRYIIVANNLEFMQNGEVVDTQPNPSYEAMPSMVDDPQAMHEYIGTVIEPFVLKHIK